MSDRGERVGVEPPAPAGAKATEHHVPTDVLVESARSEAQWSSPAAAELLGLLSNRLAIYNAALRAIAGPADAGPWITVYRAAGGGYEGLQAIAAVALLPATEGNPLRLAWRKAQQDVVEIARCPEHGLHGDRHACFVCGGPVERVRMVPVEPWPPDEEPRA